MTRRDYERHASRVGRQPTATWDDEPTPVPVEMTDAARLAWDHASSIDTRLSHRLSNVDQLIKGSVASIADLKGSVAELAARVEAREKQREEELKLQQDRNTTVRWLLGIVIVSAITLISTSVGSCIQSERRMSSIESSVSHMTEQVRHITQKLEQRP